MSSPVTRRSFSRSRGGNARGTTALAVIVSTIALAICLNAERAAAQAVPGPPISLRTSTAPGTAVVTFAWQTPVAGDAPQSYQLEIGRSPGASDAGTFDVGLVLTFSTSLLPGGYVARVRARNAVGLGAASNESTFVVTCGETEVGPPGPLTYSWRTGTRLDLTWSQPAGFLEGLRGYYVEVGTPTAPILSIFELGPGATSYAVDVSSLPVAPTYVVRVRTRSNCSPTRSTEEIKVPWPPLPAASPVVINEFGPFLELRNRSNAPVDISGWRIHVSLFEGNRTFARKVIDPGIVLNAGCSYLLAPDTYAFPAVLPDARMNETDADGIALVRPDGWVADQVGRLPRAGRPPSPYFEGLPIQSSADGVPLSVALSYTRMAGGADTENNHADFTLQAPPTPESGAACGVIPGAPRDLRFAVMGTTVTLRWSSPAIGAVFDRYIIEAGATPGDTSLARFVTSADTLTTTVVNVPAGTYYVRIRGGTASGSGPPTNEVVITVCAASACAAPPTAPRQLAALVEGSTVILNWLPPAGAQVASYVLEAGSSSGLANLAVFEVAAPTTGIAVGAVPRGVYFVRVRGRTAGVVGSASNEITVIVP